MRKLFLVRHGETDWNREGRFQGHTDVELSDVGRQQARALAEKLRSREIGAIACSDLLRAKQTASILAEELNAPIACVDGGLRERGYGCFEGLTRAECGAKFPELWASHAKGESVEVPGAERRELVMDRIVRSVKRCVETQSEGTSIAVISHGGVMRMFLEAACGARVPPIANTATYVIEYEAGRFRTPRMV